MFTIKKYIHSYTLDKRVKKAKLKDLEDLISMEKLLKMLTLRNRLNKRKPGLYIFENLSNVSKTCVPIMLLPSANAFGFLL